MSMELIFATNNQHKADEMNAVLPAHIKILTLRQAGINIDIPEPHETLEKNAIEKAATIYGLLKKCCFAEDTGLEVEALNGAPGVRSARYAGDKADAAANRVKLFQALIPHQNRTAQFRTVICLVYKGRQHLFEGICKGRIALQESGAEGFGYDAMFIPDGADKTFAEMPLAEKSSYSHRRKAVDKLVTFLNTCA